MKFKYKIMLALFLVFGQADGVSQVTFDSQIKKMSDTLAARLTRMGKKRVAVSNFVDLQGNSTELGKYIAESFSIELSNSTGLTVIDRSRITDLLQELKLTEEKLTRPENALKLGQMAGVEYIITGTTIPLEKTVDITIKALDIQSGVSIAGQRETVPRTDAMNNLMNSTVSGGNQTAANVNAGRKIEVSNKSAADVLFEVGITDMRPSECSERGLGSNYMFYFGQACFENQTDYDLVLSIPYDERYPNMQILIPKGGRNCYPRKIVNRYDQAAMMADVTFTFTTTGINPAKKGTFLMTLEKCKVKSVVLTKKNLYLQ